MFIFQGLTVVENAPDRLIKQMQQTAFIYNLDVGRLLAVRLQPGFPVTVL